MAIAGVLVKVKQGMEYSISSSMKNITGVEVHNIEDGHIVSVIEATDVNEIKNLSSIIEQLDGVLVVLPTYINHEDFHILSA